MTKQFATQLASVAVCFLTAIPAVAATGTWSGGAGATWTTGTTNWSNLTGTPWDSTNGGTNSAVFNTGGATPTVSGTVWVNAMTFTNTATVSGGVITLAGSVPTVTTSANATITSVLAGSAGLTKAGNSTLTLAATNTYTGTTAINGGGITLDFSNASSPATNILASTSALTMGGTGGFGAQSTLTLAGKASTVNSQTVNGLLLNAGRAAITLTANATSNPLLLSVGAITRNTGASLNITQPTGTISSSNGVITTSANSSSGILGGWATVGGADWAVANAGSGITALGSYTNDTWAAGNNTTVTTGATVADGATTNSLRFNAAGANTLTLSGTATVASGGILVTATVGNNLTQISGGTLRGASGADLVVHQYNTSNGLTIGSVIADNGSATGLTKTGGGTLTLSSANTFSGETRVNAGTLTLGDPAALQNSTFDTGMGSVGTLSFGTLTSATFGGLEGSNNVSLPNNFSLTFGGNNQTTTNNGEFTSGSNSNSTITKTGSGSFNWVGNRTITYGQSLNLVSGTINTTGWVQLGFKNSTNPADYAGTVNQSGGTWQSSLNGTILFIGHSGAATNVGVGTYNLSSGTIALTGSQEIRLGNQSSGGDGRMNVTGGAITSSTSTTLLRLAFADGSKGTYTQSGGIATFGTIDIASLNTLGASGSGAVTLSGGTLSATTLNVGTKQQGTFTLSDTGVFNLAGTATVGGATTSSGTMNLNGGRLNFTTASANITTGSSGVVNVSGVTFANQAGTSITVTAPMVIGVGGLTVAASSTSSGAWVNLSGNLSGSGAVTLDSQSGNTFQLSGSNSFTGGIVASSGYWHGGQNNSIPVGSAVTNNGTWGVTGDATIGSLSGNGGIFNTDNAVPRTVTIGSGNASSSFSGGIGNTQNLAFVKAGSGTFTLSGAWQHSGGTTINGGMLSIASAGALSGTAGTVTINGGELKYNSATALTRPIAFTAGTLSGTGSIGSAVSVGSNAILSPGNSPGSQSFTQGLTFDAGGRYTWEINDWAGSPGTGYDRLVVSGSALNITAISGSTFTIAITGLTGSNTVGAVTGFNNAVAKTFTIATSGSLTNFAANKFAIDSATSFSSSNSLNNGGFTIGSSGNDIVLNYVPSAIYNLSAAASATAIRVGGTSTITATITSSTSAVTGPDSLAYTGLGLSNGLGTVSASGTLAGGLSGSGNVLYTGTAAGAFTFNPSVTSGSNINIATTANAGLNTGVSVSVYNLASATNAQTINVGNIYAGSTKTASVTLTNTAPVNATYTETLSTGGFTGTSSGFTAAGSASLIAGGTSGSGTLLVGLGSGLSAGAVSGTTVLSLYSNAVNSSGLGTIGIGSQTITITGNVYNKASAAASQTVNVGNFHVGDTATKALSLTNSAPANATYTETLGSGGFSSTTGGFTATGSVTGIAGSSSGSGSLQVGFSTVSAGARNGSTVLSLNSEAVNSNGLGTSGFASQTISITGGVYDYANAKYTGRVLDFGIVHQGASVSSQTVAIGNQAVTNASYQDHLDVSGSSTNGAFTVTGFTGLAASASGTSTKNLSVGVSTATAGSLDGTVNVSLVSNASNSGLANGVASVAGTPGSITTTGGVFSGNGIWNVNGGGSWGTGASSSWRSTENVSAAPGTFTGFANTDTASFDSAIGSGTGTITLDGAQVSLASLSFNNTTGRYVIQKGTGSGSLTLAASSGKPFIAVLGTHEIATAILGTSGLQKTGIGKLILSGSNNYSGGTEVAAGTLAVNGSIAGNVSVLTGAELGGSGVIGGNIGGDGLIGPGNSPGILTVQGKVDPTATTSFAFEFMQQGDPIWSTATGSKNDVLQLTNMAPFVNQLTTTNIVNIYFEVESLAKDDTFRGGFFSNYASGDLNFASAIGSPTYHYYVLGSGSGTHDYNGKYYYTFDEYKAANPGLGITGVTTSVVTSGTADFSNGTIYNGQVTQFVIIPEPDTIIFAGIGIGMAGWTLWKRRSIAHSFRRPAP